MTIRIHLLNLPRFFLGIAISRIWFRIDDMCRERETNELITRTSGFEMISVDCTIVDNDNDHSNQNICRSRISFCLDSCIVDMWNDLRFSSIPRSSKESDNSRRADFWNGTLVDDYNFLMSEELICRCKVKHWCDVFRRSNFASLELLGWTIQFIEWSLASSCLTQWIRKTIRRISALVRKNLWNN